MFKLDKTAAIIYVVIGVVMVLFVSLLNRPITVPSWPDTLNGVSFSPFRINQTPEDITSFPSEEEVLEDLKLVDKHANAIRTYSVEGVLGDIPRLATQTDLEIVVGVWLSSDPRRNQQELKRLAKIAPDFNSQVKSIVVGNEVLLRKELTAFEIVNFIQRVRRIVGDVPITVAETWDIWLENPALSRHVDFITAHVLPYWEGISAEAAPDYVISRYQQLQQTFPDKPILLGEVGWPSAGRQLRDAVPSQFNQTRFMRHFLELAHAEKAQYFAMEAFDQPWKVHEGEVGRYWGIYDASRQPKQTFENLSISPVNAWLPMAIATFFTAGLLTIVMLRDGRALRVRGKAFLVAVSFGISGFFVWHLHSYLSQYLVGSEIVIALLLLICVCAVATALAVEAHEWAETLWQKKRITTAPCEPLRSLGMEVFEKSKPGPTPKVSIHVPIHNEPPSLVIKTLQALQRLDYPNYEVLVIDNNTDSEDTWMPVYRWCEEQGSLYHFHHVKSLAGFKAGALNYALEHTAEDAQVIAVIDSDYMVRSDWLSDCIPLFDDKDIAVVQAPQDYRDADENLFKSMLYCEYAGFFGIGMINRNVRNAIIQHGTMTLVRRSALQEVDGWSQWCITEDAELGLKILEAGHRAVYVPTSYGRGLMPDTFHDYRMQRFRWAYGSMRILRKHASQLGVFTQSNLTAGQRFHFLAGWLPWLSDALSLMFNLFAIGFSIALIFVPHLITPPAALFSALPLAFFGFKVCKMLMLYRYRLKAGLRQSFAAAIAGLAVSHTIARAMFAGMFDNNIGFFRTPKQADAHSVFRAFQAAREECLLAVALLLSASAISFRDDTYLADTRLWIALLCVQSVPYVSSVLLSMVSSMQNASASLILNNDQPLAEKGQAFQTGLNAGQTAHPSSIPATTRVAGHVHGSIVADQEP